MRDFIAYAPQPPLDPVGIHCFNSLDLRLGQVRVCEENRKARVPSLRLEMDFGDGFNDLKQSSAQLRDNYLAQGEVDEEARKAALLGRQIAAVVNFPKRSVGVPSFFLTLGVVSLTGEETGTVVLVPLAEVPNGSQVKLLNDCECSVGKPRRNQVKYEDTFHHLDIRVGTVVSADEMRVDFGEPYGERTLFCEYPILKEGMQVLRAFNLEGLEDADNILGVVTEEGERIPLTLERKMPNGRFLK